MYGILVGFQNFIRNTEGLFYKNKILKSNVLLNLFQHLPKAENQF